jgi:hypothetical protein
MYRRFLKQESQLPHRTYGREAATGPYLSLESVKKIDFGGL